VEWSAFKQQIVDMSLFDFYNIKFLWIVDIMVTEESLVLNRRSEAKKKTWQNPDYRNRMMKLYNSEEWRKQRSIDMKIALNKPEVKQKLIDRAKEAVLKPERREQLLKILRDPETLKRKREANAKPEFRKNASEKQKALWEDPIYRESQLRSLKERSSKPEYRKKASDAALRRFQNPEELKKLSDRMKKMGADPEHRKKLSKALKEKHADPDYHKKLCESRADPKYRELHRILQADPIILLRKIEGTVGGFWYGNVRYIDGIVYCEKFNREFKERVRAFRGYICFECGEPQNGSLLMTHHVHYDKKMCCNGSPHDIVPLCNSCHSKTNFNRDYWEDHFTDLIYASDPEGKCFFTKEEMKSFLGGLA
jgi:hypothetical protein